MKRKNIKKRKEKKNTKRITDKLTAMVLIILVIGLPLRPLLAANGEGIVYINKNTILGQSINGKIIITADNITLNCNGHKIKGSGSGNGVSINFKNNVTIKNCIIENFENGIYSESYPEIPPSNNTFTQNNIANNENGILLWCSSNNKIFENNISNNQLGIGSECLTLASNNLAYHNNFKNNNQQSFVAYPHNDFFDNGYPEGGNYWSDYGGEDLKKGENQDQDGSDGIGDASYNILTVEKDLSDRYPFMEENGWQAKEVPEWRKDIQPGDILYDAGALPIHKAGVVLYSIGHMGIYVGDVEVEGKILHNQTVEANKKFADGKTGVQYRNIETWDYPQRKLVYLLRIDTSDEIKENAIGFAKTQADANKPYDPFWIQKDPNPDSLSWYCSELVWAAYYNQGINLEKGEESFNNPVAPEEIYNDSDTLVIADHLNYLAYYKEEYLKSLVFQIFSPVNVEITDPDGNVISKEIDGIDDAVYIIDDIDDDREYEDIIAIENRKHGPYTIRITPKPDAESGDTYTLKVFAGDAEIILAEDLPVNDIPEGGQFFTLSSTPLFINGASVDEDAPQGFHDEEISPENIFSAGILDFFLNSSSDFSPTTTPTTTTNRNINIANDGNLGFQYTVTTTNATNTLCEHLNLTANLDGNPIYEGPLASFNYNAGEFSASVDDWQFTATLNDNDPALQNQTCQFDFVFNGNQIGGAGFFDQEIISNTIVSGEWEYNPPPSNFGNVIINEVMWMGSSASTADEWIELKNMTDSVIDISQWKIKNALSSGNDLMIPASNIIPANGYFLIANYPKTSANSALNVEVDEVNASISLHNEYDTNEALILKDAGDNIIDSTPIPINDNWPAGDNETIKKSMERNNDPVSGWHTCDTLYMTPEEINLMRTYWKVDARDLLNYGTPGSYNLSANDPSADDYQGAQDFETRSFAIAQDDNENVQGEDSGVILNVTKPPYGWSPVRSFRLRRVFRLEEVKSQEATDTGSLVADAPQDDIIEDEKIILEKTEEVIIEEEIIIDEPEKIDEPDEPKEDEDENLDDNINNLNEESDEN